MRLDTFCLFAKGLLGMEASKTKIGSIDWCPLRQKSILPNGLWGGVGKVWGVVGQINSLLVLPPPSIRMGHQLSIFGGECHAYRFRPTHPPPTIETIMKGAVKLIRIGARSGKKCFASWILGGAEKISGLLLRV